MNFDTSKYGVLYYCIEHVFHVMHLKVLLLVDAVPTGIGPVFILL